MMWLSILALATAAGDPDTWTLQETQDPPAEELPEPSLVPS